MTGIGSNQTYQHFGLRQAAQFTPSPLLSNSSQLQSQLAQRFLRIVPGGIITSQRCKSSYLMLQAASLAQFRRASLSLWQRTAATRVPRQSYRGAAVITYSDMSFQGPGSEALRGLSCAGLCSRCVGSATCHAGLSPITITNKITNPITLLC